MIITRLSGGLGNQMFQYAMGRALSLRNNTDLCIDTSSYASLLSGEAPRLFTLEHFSIEGTIATRADFATLGIPEISDRSLYARGLRALIRLRDRFLPPKHRRFVVERGFSFMRDAYDAGPDCLLSGVWQSAKYFADVEQQIRSDFNLKLPLTSLASDILKDIQVGTSVSLHVRRGDYVTNANTGAKHGVCSPEYYRAAITHLHSVDSAIRLFIFSDNIEWTQNNLDFPDETIFVTRPELADHEELILMSSCRHHILANSTFSWWGAWLNENPEKIVIAPEKWFSGNTDTKDLIPASWIKL